MRYRLMAAGAVLVLIAAFLISGLDGEAKTRRIHQHLTARQEDSACGCAGMELCTHLPLLIIDTGGIEIPGEPLSEDGLTMAEGGDVDYEYEYVTMAEDGSSTIQGYLPCRH